MSDDRVKIRITNPYKGSESAQFGGARVPVGAIVTVTGERARQIIANGNGEPVLGPTETKNAKPGSVVAEAVERKKGTDAMAGSEALPSSSDQAQASPAKTAAKPSAAPAKKAGKSSR